MSDILANTAGRCPLLWTLLSRSLLLLGTQYMLCHVRWVTAHNLAMR
jgi:hypothetical protein